MRHRLSPRSFLRSLAVLALLSGATACGNGDGDGTPTSPSANVPFEQADLRVGTGTEATSGRTVTVNYAGWLYDGSRAEQKGALFDTSVGRGAFTFRLGAGQVITGWEQGVPGMKVGGVRRLVIPPSLGYGSTPNGSIPGNSTLLFEVELLGVQ